MTSTNLLIDDAGEPARKIQYVPHSDALLHRVARYNDLRFLLTNEHIDDPRSRRYRAPLIADRAVSGDELAAIDANEGMTIELARFVPGGYITPHLHPTLEYVMVLEGVAHIILNEEWDTPISLYPYDSIAIPPNALRSFGNPMTDRDCLMLIAVIETHRNALLPAAEFTFVAAHRPLDTTQHAKAVEPPPQRDKRDVPT